MRQEGIHVKGVVQNLLELIEALVGILVALRGILEVIERALACVQER